MPNVWEVLWLALFGDGWVPAIRCQSQLQSFGFAAAPVLAGGPKAAAEQHICSTSAIQKSALQVQKSVHSVFASFS